MATTAKVLYRGAASTTTSTTLYTVPSATTAVVTNIVVSNSSASDQTFTMAIDGVEIHSATSISANSSIYIDLKQVIDAAGTITGGASATSVAIHVSGAEIV